MVDFPFVYLNHGPLEPESFDKVDCAWIAFRGPISEADRAFVATSCPDPLHGFFHADDALFYCETPGDVFNAMTAEQVGGQLSVTRESAAAFSAEVERWVLAVHERTPIAFFIGPAAPLDWSEAWNAWSYQMVPTVVVDWLEHYLDTHPDLPLEAPDAIEDVADDDADWDWPVSPMDRHTVVCIFQHLGPVDDPDEDSTALNARLAALAARLG